MIKRCQLNFNIFIVAILFLGFAVTFSHKYVLEYSAKNYLQDFNSKNINKIIITNGPWKVEIFDKNKQSKILTYISSIDVSLGADLEAPGAMPMKITVIYEDSSQKELTLNTFAYPGITGLHGFDCKINGESALLSFTEFFEFPKKEHRDVRLAFWMLHGGV